MTEPANPPFDSPLDDSHRTFEPYTAFTPLEEALEQQLGAKSKLQLPERYRQGFVRFLPWLVLLFLPLHFAAVLLLLGITALATLFGSFSYAGALVSTVVFVLHVIALPGLFGRTRRGWTFYFYALLVSAVGNLLSLSLFGLLVSALLVWIVFQVKYHYR